MTLEAARAAFEELLALGGPVVAVLLALSILALSLMFWKLMAFTLLGVGRHRRLTQALAAFDRGDVSRCLELGTRSRSHLAPILAQIVERSSVERTDRFRKRMTAEAAGHLDTAARGLRLLDSIAQIAPLLGLFGTVLGMINAFRALQGAGATVDPSVLAGGIWVALLTTAVGLAVAMPTALIVTWLESRLEEERGFADQMIARLFSPMRQRGVDTFKRSATARTDVAAQ